MYLVERKNYVIGWSRAVASAGSTSRRVFLLNTVWQIRCRYYKLFHLAPNCAIRWRKGCFYTRKPSLRLQKTPPGIETKVLLKGFHAWRQQNFRIFLTPLPCCDVPATFVSCRLDSCTADVPEEHNISLHLLPCDWRINMWLILSQKISLRSLWNHSTCHWQK